MTSCRRTALHAAFAVVLVAIAIAGRDLYAILGVKRQATVSEIKKAYRKAAMKYHPDKYKGDKKKGQKIFADLAHAYEVHGRAIAQ